MLDSILAALSPANPWREKVQYFDNITSTNDVLKQLAAQGAPEGTSLIAGSQSGGRGRMGRSFLSPPEAGIYMSVLLRPQCSPLELIHLTCAAGCAACDAIEQAIGLRPGIKWINDIVYEGHKLAGILVEMGLSNNGMVSYAVIGIGINCNQTQFPQELDMATSLRIEAGRPADVNAIAAALLLELSRMRREFLSRKSDWIAAFSRNCLTVGKDIQILRAGTVRQAKATGIGPDAELLVEYPDGTSGSVSSGEVSVRGLYGYV